MYVFGLSHGEWHSHLGIHYLNSLVVERSKRLSCVVVRDAQSDEETNKIVATDTEQ
jgi:hypothetical protein